MPSEFSGASLRGSVSRALLRSLALASMVLPAAASAEIHPRALPTLERYLNATGGSAARQGEQTVHFHGRIHSIGFYGTWDLWQAAPDRWVRRYRLGPLRIREGYDGTVAWRTDLTGKSVRLLSTAETAHAREDGWFMNERWAMPDQDSARIMPGNTVYGSDASYDQLVVTPPWGGDARRFFVNQKTGFIERVAYEVDGNRVEDHPGAYKLLGGRRRPSVFASPTLLATDKPVEKISVDSIEVNPTLDSSFFSPPQLQERAIAWHDTSHAIRAPFSYGSKAVLVNVSINGARPAEFILDTGASLSLIDQNYAFALGLRAEGKASVQGIAATGSMRFARVKSIALAGPDSAAAALRDFRVALIDIAEDGQIILWKKPMGILGSDFLSRFVVEIDYDRQMVTLYDPAGFQYHGEGTPIPFELNGNCPIVDLTVDDGCTGKFLVDVGNSFHFTVHGTMVRGCRMIGTKKRQEVEVAGGGIGGGFVSTLCRLDSLKLGPYVWTEPVAALALHTSGGIGSREISGNIGNSVLERFKCTFDYARQQLYLEPGQRFVERDRVSRFGALFARVGPHVYAGNILTGSAAYVAGLRWFDEIVAVDGRPLEDWTREEVDRVLEEGDLGSEHTVTYKRFRGDPATTVTVKLKDVL